MWRRALLLLILGVVLVGVIRAQRGRYRGEDDEPLITPSDAGEKSEFNFARLRYPDYGGGRRGRGYGWGRGSWTTDFPKADRQFLQGVRRLTRIHTRSLEEVADPDGDGIYNYPWIYAVEVGHWALTDPQTQKLRDYLLRGGFLMVDDFHGSYEWSVFMESMNRVFPDRPVVDLDSSDAVFHVIYDLDQRVQVPGISPLFSGRTYEQDGVTPRWRGIYDDRNRLLVAICHNMDLGDAWEWADSPRYPEHYASLAYRIGVNYIVYAFSH
ncbi:MAG TPA: DUF4159 domain-containing protein [Bryobacteraceae bacterium]|nr:DUF4159 domain-containing protein [Bryobacteraceae bacterium]